MLEGFKKIIIAKKTLAAGRLPPKEAFQYIASTRCVDAVAVGIASEREAEETFSIAIQYFASSTETY
jgi:predicted aldo/keto reductase-like oxidoreductase